MVVRGRSGSSCGFEREGAPKLEHLERVVLQLDVKYALGALDRRDVNNCT